MLDKSKGSFREIMIKTQHKVNIIFLVFPIWFSHMDAIYYEEYSQIYKSKNLRAYDSLFRLFISLIMTVWSDKHTVLQSSWFCLTCLGRPVTARLHVCHNL